MSKNNHKCFASAELVSAFLLPHLTDIEVLNFLETPLDFIRTHCNVDIPEDFNIDIVVNTDEQISLALPYYSELDELKSKALSDEDLEIIVGGEIIVAASHSAESIATTTTARVSSFAAFGRAMCSSPDSILVCRWEDSVYADSYEE